MAYASVSLKNSEKAYAQIDREGPVVSLFPRLTDGPGRRREQTAVKHSVDRVAKRRVFNEGEKVIIYDLKTKLSSIGKINKVLGNNTYLAEYNGHIQHVSGDVITRFSKDNSNVNSHSRDTDGNSSSRDGDVHADGGRCPDGPDGSRCPDHGGNVDGDRCPDDGGNADGDRWPDNGGNE